MYKTSSIQFHSLIQFSFVRNEQDFDKYLYLYVLVRLYLYIYIETFRFGNKNDFPLNV